MSDQVTAKTPMSKQLLVRNVPSDICTWINQQRGLTNMSQQEVVRQPFSIAGDMYSK